MMTLNKMVVPLAFIPLIALTLLAQRWLGKQYTEGTAEEIDQAINDSPWVQLCPMRLQRPNDYESLIATGQYANWPLNYRIRLLTARPVREAMLLYMTLPADVLNNPRKTKSVDVGELSSEAKSRRQHVEAFMASHPNDIRVKGDDENIVVAITLTKFVQSSVLAGYEVNKGRPQQGASRNIDAERQDAPLPGLSDWVEDPRPANLLHVRLADLAPKTFLSTNSGKKAQLSRYDPPGMDMLGAKFYFPRKLPDGTFLITADARELRFESVIDKKRIKVKFDLKEMAYKGKLEF